MNLKPIISFFIFSLLSITAFSQYKRTQKLGSFATIALPDTVVKTVDKDGLKMYLVRYHDVIFLANVSDVSGGLKNLFVKGNIDSLYSGYIHGMVNATKGKLFYKNKLKINGNDGVEFGYKSSVNGQLTYRYQHAVAVKDTLVMAGIWSSDSLSKDDKNLALFFNGFKIKSKEELDEEHTYQLGYNAGKFIGDVLFVGLIIGAGFLLIYFIRKIMAKSAKA